MEYMTLMGAEQVSNAGYAMRSAAEDMNRAASNMDHTFEMNKRFMDDWLNRFESVVEQLILLGKKEAITE